MAAIFSAIPIALRCMASAIAAMGGEKRQIDPPYQPVFSQVVDGSADGSVERTQFGVERGHLGLDDGQFALALVFDVRPMPQDAVELEYEFRHGCFNSFRRRGGLPRLSAPAPAGLFPTDRSMRITRPIA